MTENQTRNFSVEEKLAIVKRYEEGREFAADIARECGYNISTIRKWVRAVRKGKELRDWGGYRPHHSYDQDEELIKWFAHFKNKGWSMREISRKLEVGLYTTYKIQEVAQDRGLIDSNKARKRGQH